MEEERRRVIFTLEREGASMFDYENESECEEKAKERSGFFHAWGNAPFWDSEEGHLRDRVVGIVEEENTGKVFQIVPKMITFKK